MADAFKFDLSTIKGVPDPTTESGELFLFDEALGQDGRPFVFLVEDPPNKTRERHYHHGDVLYVYTKGEHTIDGEGTYRAGDLRWTRAGHVYGPETTGPEGGAWWVVSYNDPIPVDVPIESEASAAQAETQRVGTANELNASLPRFSAPYDWKQIDEAVRTVGGAIVEALVSDDELRQVNDSFDDYLKQGDNDGLPTSGNAIYDTFLGHKTIRLHGLIEKVPTVASLIGRDDLLDWAERSMSSLADSVQLNAGELIQIEPGEPAQYTHRDSDSWPLPIGDQPFIVNAIVALDPCTEENGATYIAPQSWNWDTHRAAKQNEFARATMNPGDAVLFRGDVLHGGGENKSAASRRVLSISYCAGWLRPVENSFLNVTKEVVVTLPSRTQAALGYAAHDASKQRGGMVGLYEGGDPGKALSGR